MDSSSLIMKDLQTVTALPGTADKVTSRLFYTLCIEKELQLPNNCVDQTFYFYLGKKTSDSQNTFSIHVGEKSVFLYI